MASTYGIEGDDSVFELFLGIFFLAAAVLAFVFQINYVVLEKELKHRQVMYIFQTKELYIMILWV